MLLSSMNSYANERMFTDVEQHSLANLLKEREICLKDLFSCNATVDNIKKPEPDHSGIVAAAFVTFLLAGAIGFIIGKEDR